MARAMDPLLEAKRALLKKYVQGEFTPPPIPSSRKSDASQDAADRMWQDPGDHIGCSPSTGPAEGYTGIGVNAIKRPLVRRALNRILHLLCRFFPGATSVRPFLHRIRGVKIGKNVWIGDDVYLENEFPEQVEIRDGAVIGLRTIIVAHTRGAGKIVIGENVFIGAGAVVIAPSNRILVIGEGAVIVASSLINASVAPYTLYGSEGAKPLAKVTRPLATATYEEFITTLLPLRR